MTLHAPSKDGPKLISQASQFTLDTLHRTDLHQRSPIPQFHTWFTQAQAARVMVDEVTSETQSPPPDSHSSSHAIPHPETCTLSTAHLPTGRVSSRMVYLKELDAAGNFVIYTNLGTSRKAADLATNPHASLVFWWEALQRQVRVEGQTQRLTPEESQAYFDTRVRGSRVGAWASRQSRVLVPRGEGGEGEAGEASSNDNPADDDNDDGRAQLEEWVKAAEARFEGRDSIPVPEFWGGLRVVPDRVEFWQGRESRLHDRFVYERVQEEGQGEGGEGKWTLNRLSP